MRNSSTSPWSASRDRMSTSGLPTDRGGVVGPRVAVGDTRSMRIESSTAPNSARASAEVPRAPHPKCSTTGTASIGSRRSCRRDRGPTASPPRPVRRPTQTHRRLRSTSLGTRARRYRLQSRAAGFSAHTTAHQTGRSLRSRVRCVGTPCRRSRRSRCPTRSRRPNPVAHERSDKAVEGRHRPRVIAIAPMAGV